jgi:ASPIC and UnbV/FG-GAP repeat
MARSSMPSLPNKPVANRQHFLLGSLDKRVYREQLPFCYSPCSSFALSTPPQVKSTSSAEFVDVTESAGIKFVHFKGSDGMSINLEEFGPGVCVSYYDRDGWQDIYFVNGRDRYDRGIPAKNAPRAGRGVAFADFDNDGYVDVVVANNGDPPTLLRNVSNHANHFVNFKLVGTKSNRDALGARIRVTSGKISQIREIVAGGSYLSQSDLRANFGLGNMTVALTVEVAWPSGARQVFHDIKADRFYLIEEGREK